MKHLPSLFLCLALLSASASASPFQVDQAGNVPVTPAEQAATAPPPGASLGEIIMAKIGRCWVPPTAENAGQMPAVTVDASLDKDGTVTNIVLGKESEAAFKNDQAFREIAMQAMLAIKACSPIGGLPPAQYENWKQLHLTFPTAQAIMPEAAPQQY